MKFAVLLALLLGCAGNVPIAMVVFDRTGVCVHELETGVFGSRTDIDGSLEPRFGGHGGRASYREHGNTALDLDRRDGEIGAVIKVRVDLTSKACQQ